MKKHSVNMVSLILFAIFFLAGCGSGQLFGPTPTPIPTATLMPRDITFDEMELQLSKWFEGAEFVHLFDTSHTEMYGGINNGIPGSSLIMGKTPNGNVRMVSLAFDETNMETGLKFYKMYLSKYASSEALDWVELNLSQIKDTNLEKSFETPYRTVHLILGLETESLDGKYLMVIYEDAK
jgi:hypothetical protein